MQTTPHRLLLTSISFLALISGTPAIRGSDLIVVSRSGTLLDSRIPPSSDSIGAMSLSPFSFVSPAQLSTALDNESLAFVATPEMDKGVSELSLPLRSPDFSGRLMFPYPTQDAQTPEGGMLVMVRWFAALFTAGLIFWHLRKRVIPSFE
jgi:hypothetical protein